MADFFAKGKNPITGYGGKDHGIYELWKGSSSATFAAQTITIDNIDVSKIDTFFIEVMLLADEVLPSVLFCIDKDVSNSTKYLRWVDTGGKLQRYQRPFTMTYTDNSVSFSFQNTTFLEWATYGASSPTTQTSNGNLIPYRILGLIHND